MNNFLKTGLITRFATQSFDGNINVRNSFHHVNGGIEGSVGLNYQVLHCSVFIEGGGNYGFFNIQKAAQNGKNENGAAIATIGYRYRFGK